jgi:hypothetical protein
VASTNHVRNFQRTTAAFRIENGYADHAIARHSGVAAMAMKRMPNCFDALRALLHEKQSVETVVTLYRV